MKTSTLGLFVGLLLAIAIAAGGYSAFLGALVLGTIGYLAGAQLDGDVDGELHVDDVARWLAGLTTAHRSVRTNHPEIDPDTELAGLRRIVTRWLHPARPR